MEKETDTIYELNQEEAPELTPQQPPAEPRESADDVNSDASEQPEQSDLPVNSSPPEEIGEKKSSTCTEAENEIAGMVKEMGAERVLDLIRGNRNSAIEQILAELESSADRTLQSGVSVGCPCNSIFDLAAQA